MLVEVGRLFRYFDWSFGLQYPSFVCNFYSLTFGFGDLVWRIWQWSARWHPWYSVACWTVEVQDSGSVWPAHPCQTELKHIFPSYDLVKDTHDRTRRHRFQFSSRWFLYYGSRMKMQYLISRQAFCLSLWTRFQQPPAESYSTELHIEYKAGPFSTYLLSLSLRIDVFRVGHPCFASAKGLSILCEGFHGRLPIAF